MIAVDSSVLIDLLGEDVGAGSAEAALRKALSEGPVVLCDVVISEITAGLGHGAEIMDAVEEMGLRYLPVEQRAAVRAGEMQRRYHERLLARGNDGLAPRTDPIRPRYDDVVAAVVDSTTQLAEQAVARGVPREGILIDPAIDFSKNTFHSLTVLRHVRTLVETGWPVLMAMSNKGVVGETLDVALDDRLTGTLAATALAAQAGAAMFRAHQVRETRHTIEMVASIVGTRPPARAQRWLT